MRTVTGRRLAAPAALCFAVSTLFAFSLPALAQPGEIDAEAQRLLKASTNFLSGQQRFSAETRNTLEVVLISGQKIEFNHQAMLAVERPNRLRAERFGDLTDQVFVYDGASLTLSNPLQKVYAQVPAPGSLDAMLDFARNDLDIVAPAGDLIYTNPYAILMDGVTEGFVVGKAVIEGVVCDHLAFRAPHVDLQVWVQEGDRPLPRKLVITTRDIVNAPQFSVTISNWNIEPVFDDQTFTFTSADDVARVDFLPR